MTFGFWGTHREKAWHKRKDREYQRKAEVRQDEGKNLERASAQHKADINDKEHVLKVSRRLLKVRGMMIMLRRGGTWATTHAPRLHIRLICIILLVTVMV